MRSKLLSITIKNLGCIGEKGLTVDLDNILCLVGENNTGKSTVLRAYELALGSKQYSYARDYCNKSSNGSSSVEISVHIPKEIGNIAEKWKVKKGKYLVVQSKWEWDSNGVKLRKTYDPEIDDYSEDGNAAGLDNVFNSRLPKPFRIGALENPEVELRNLLKIIVEPIASNLRRSLENDESELSKALVQFTSQARKPVEAEKKKIDEINEEIGRVHGRIFPNLSVDLDIGLSDIRIDPMDSLLKGSKLSFKEYRDSVDWNQQGTGSQRALFWSLLQVRSRLQAMSDLRIETDKKIKALQKEISKLEKEKEKAKRDETKIKKEELIQVRLSELEKLKTLEVEMEVDSDEDDIALPGYMLLIDEPEVALHPNAVRSASSHLYELARDSRWQVMVTTHSPLFLNPFEDHTTIVRLSRSVGNPSPKTYRSDEIEFTSDERENLKLLNSFDQNLAEMFFGQYPLIVEGDTEFAAFRFVVKKYSDEYNINDRPIIIRARGKGTISPIIKMLQHFKVDFSVLHDTDFPKNKNGNTNSSWSLNNSIYDSILNARRAGCRVVHRVSISTFETHFCELVLSQEGLYLEPSAKDKPWKLIKTLENDPEVLDSVKKLFDSLLDKNVKEEPFTFEFSKALNPEFRIWVTENDIQDIRFQVNTNMISLNQKLKRVEIRNIEVANKLVFDYFDSLPSKERDEKLVRALYIGVLALMEDRLSSFFAKTANQLGTELESLKLIFDMKQELFYKASVKGSLAEDDIASFLNGYFESRNLKDTVVLTGNSVGELPRNKTGDIICNVNGSTDLRISVECKFDKNIRLGDIKNKDLFIRKTDTAWSQLIESDANRRSRVSLIVFDSSLVDGGIINTFDSIGYIPSIGFVVIVDSQRGDYSNLGIAYTLARDIALNSKVIDLDKEILSILVNRIIRDINETFKIKSLIESNISNNKEILKQLEKSLLSMEFSQLYLIKFLQDGRLDKKDLLEFYMGEDVKDKFKLLEKDIESL